jgi:5-methylcytosine-specific restriction endonuclease McrA
VNRRCLRCRRLIPTGSYCRACGATRRGTSNGWRWTEIAAHVHRRDRVCVKCGSSDGLQVHHRLPISEGGTSRLSNLELRCRRCHAEAHTQNRCLEGEDLQPTRVDTAIAEE